MFDWIPTASEVTNKLWCTMTDHNWIEIYRRGIFSHRECSECGKIKDS